MTKLDPRNGRPRLSVAMIVRDAVSLLSATLDSVRAIADEIVVADTGSSDRTVMIAREGADIVEEIEWQDSFAAARNDCLRIVTGDWVLWLDAGETLEDTAAQQLRNFVDDAAERDKAYLLFIQQAAANTTISADQIGQVRLMPHRPELNFMGRVFEQILPSVMNAKLGVDALDCVIQRGNLDCSPEKLRARAKRTLNLANLALAEKADQAIPLVARAEALAQLGRPKEAGQVYRRTIEVADHGSSEMLEAYYGLLTALDYGANTTEDQINTCLEALAIYPLDAQLLCGMGGYLLRCGRLDLAARSYEMAVTHGKVDPTIWHLADLADVAVACWTLALQLLGDPPRAESILRKALDDRPNSLRLRRQLIELYVKAGRERDALVQCGLLPDDMPCRADMPGVVRGAVLAAARKGAAALGPLRAAYQAGCRDPLCLRWLAAAHLAVGNSADVEIVAAEWARQEPCNLEIDAFRRAALKRDPGSISHAQSRRVDGPAQRRLPVDLRTVTSLSRSPRL